MVRCSVREKKESRTSLFEIWKESEWSAFEAYHQSSDFLWRDNESTDLLWPPRIDYPSLRASSPLIVDISNETPQDREIKQELRLQSVFKSIPVLAYCFSIVKRYPDDITPPRDDTPLDPEALQFLLSPPTVLSRASIPTFPVPPTESEQLVPYPTQVVWNHVNEWDMVKSLGPSMPLRTDSSSEFALNPMGLTSISSADFSIAAVNTEYTGVERMLAAWAATMTTEYNNSADCELDSFLYGTPDLEKNRFTLPSDKLNTPAAFNLSFYVSKTSDLSENTKNKRNRKRQRDGVETEEKTKPGSIGTHIHRRLNHAFIWSKKEDEMLFALILQFGAGWAFICSVFLLEELNYRARLRRDCSMRWNFLERNQSTLVASIPREAHYLLIPQCSLSKQKNAFVESEREEKKSATPLRSLFDAVKTKNVRSALFDACPLSPAVEAKLKERDSAFVAVESDRMHVLRRYLRPDPPTTPFKNTIAKGSLRTNPVVCQSSVDLSNESSSKTQYGHVPIRPLTLPRPAGIIELRRKAIESLPLATIIFDDETKFQHLLNPNRKPRESIIIPYVGALADAQRLVDEKLVPEVKEEPREAPGGGELGFAELPLEAKENSEFGSLVGKDSLSFVVPAVEVEGVEEKKVNENELADICCDELAPSESVTRPLLTREKEVEPVPEEVKPVEELAVHHTPPFVEWVKELKSSEKREAEAPPPEEMPPVLKMQKLAESSVRRVARTMPSRQPHAYYTSAPQFARSNMRFLQHYLTTQKQQLRNPKPFPQLSNYSRKDGGQSNVVVNNTVTEVSVRGERER